MRLLLTSEGIKNASIHEALLDGALGIVDFSLFPLLDHELLPENTMADAEGWAADIRNPAYAIDDETAIRVVDGTVDVISEGRWKLFAAPHGRVE
jgi:dipeptidase E